MNAHHDPVGRPFYMVMSEITFIPIGREGNEAFVSIGQRNEAGGENLWHQSGGFLSAIGPGYYFSALCVGDY
jgi:hypothetical protein